MDESAMAWPPTQVEESALNRDRVRFHGHARKVADKEKAMGIAASFPTLEQGINNLFMRDRNDEGTFYGAASCE
jgi:hypothetical protein